MSVIIEETCHRVGSGTILTLISLRGSQTPSGGIVLTPSWDVWRSVVLSPYKIDRPRRAEFLACPVDVYTMQETVDLISAAMARRERLHHVVVNVAKMIDMRHDRDLRRDVCESDLVNIDGMGVVWGCRLMGIPVPERVAGIDLMSEVLAVCEAQGYRPYFLGAREDVLEAFIEEITRRYPKLKMAGWRNGYFSRDEESGVAERIAISNADCLFVAISSPIKERFLRSHRDRLNVPFLMGVGGSFDVIAGRQSRAPKWMRNGGMEWLFRVLLEPRRLARRYIVSNMIYSVLIARALLNNSFRNYQGRRQG